MAHLLIVDDEEQVCRLLDRTLTRAGHTCIQASSAEEARKLLAEQKFDLVLSDVQMPGESGIELTKFIKAKYEDTAVIVVTAVDDSRISSAALASGVDGYVLKPFNPSELIVNTQNALHRRKLEIANKIYQQGLEKMLGNRTEQLQRALSGIIQVMTRMVEVRDPYTAGHQQRVADLAVAIATAMHLPKNDIHGIRMAGMIHDLGKISIPAEIISKPTQLSDIEFALIKTHSRRGYEIMADLEFPWPIAQIVLQHHEKMDGSGYPQGLKGDEILLEARIIGVADVVEAISSHRPYRPALGIDFALSEISRLKGTHFDVDVVNVCLNLFAEKKFSFQ